MRRWRVPVWIFVATGLVLNIISALLTNFSIDNINREANAILQQQESHEKLIELTWQQVETIERKRELILLLVSLSEGNEQPLPQTVKEQVVTEVHDWLNINISNLSTVDVPAIMQGMNDNQREYRNKINQLYIQNLALTQSHENKMNSISRLRNLALFLQILGLAFLLVRDLNRSS
ncbi:hypothetical protein [Photobacterium atrarenae]|uniref:DNA mismatch repair protein n=1 Tax=Photobacterium atrarenae TaxID=865757 RepID=A0ABY5GLV9_9GAMM|nr:hypothetical protein [Photobacterium atrarenae]UTV29725.1 hypothetical protein NNL38_22205 [Photobacterium atrarenae]